MADTSQLRNYVVVYRAAAALRFVEDGYLKLNSLKTPSGFVDLTFRTRYDDNGFDAKIPRELWIDARGAAPGINQAINEFGAAVSTFIPMLSVIENAAILDLQVHIAFDNTLGVTEREFFQAFLADERGMPRITRKCNARIASAFFESVGHMSDRDRILRACGQYQQALMYWGMGQELLALAHLYMGVEAITKAVLRQECLKRNTDEEGLAAQLGVQKKELDSTIRKQIIFQGDVECFKEARQASDGFEHGFLGFGELQELARKRRSQTATYLRNAIIELTGCDAEVQDELRKKAVAVGAWKLVRYFRGWLVGEGNELAAPDQEYPILRWRSTIQKVTTTPSGDMALTPAEEFSPRLADGISLRPGSYEVWGPETGKEREPIRQTITPKISPAQKHDPKRDRVLAVLERISRALLSYGAEQFFQATPTDAFVLALFAECRSQFPAVALLLKHGLANEALQLASGIFRNAQRLRFLAETDNKLSVILGWVRDSLDISQEIERASNEAGVELRPGQSLVGPGVGKESLLNQAKAHNIVVTGFPPDGLVIDRASPLARLGYLASKRIADGFGPIAGYCKLVSENSLGFNNTCDDTEYIAFGAAFAAESVLLACQAAGQLFGWPEFNHSGSMLEMIRNGSFGDPASGESSQ